MSHFTPEGFLPPGIHEMSAEEIKQVFVTAFNASTSRPIIYQGYDKHSADLKTLGIDVEELVGGSFISTKPEPSDIDLVCFMDANAVDNLPPEHQLLLEALTAGPVTKQTHHCDAYYCPTLPETDPLYQRVRTARKYWMGEFGFDRQDRPKGMVATTVAKSGA